MIDSQKSWKIGGSVTVNMACITSFFGFVIVVPSGSAATKSLPDVVILYDVPLYVYVPSFCAVLPISSKKALSSHSLISFSKFFSIVCGLIF